MDLLFNPSSVAVAGVSFSEENLGQNIVSNLINLGLKGEILCFGKREGYIFGHRIRTSLEDIPRGIDVAVLLVPAKAVLETVSAFVRKGANRFVVETSGFSELSDESLRIRRLGIHPLFPTPEAAVRVLIHTYTLKSEGVSVH